MKGSVWLHLGRSSRGKSPAGTHYEGGRKLADKIGVGTGGDIVVATSTTQVWCTHTSTKSVSAPARRSISCGMQSSQHGSHTE